LEVEMRRLLILGAGTAGTIVANKLRRRLPVRDWNITVVDPGHAHLYQPGLLFMPFGDARGENLLRPRDRSLRRGVDFVQARVDRVVPHLHRVDLSDGRTLLFDYLVIATGTTPQPDQTPGMLGPEWRRSIHEFYTLHGALALRGALQKLAHSGGRLVVHITDMPIKCPVAPLEFAFLADAYLRRLGVRDTVELVYATPLPGAFTKPVASARLSSMLDERKIALEADFLVERIDPQRRVLISYDEREIPFDLLVTVPLNMGADFIARSGLGDELNYVPVDRHTLRSKVHNDIFAIGDAADLPTSKAGSVAHFSAEVFAHNFVELAAGRPMTASFDGHANCFVESGDDKALLIDFNYDTEPLPGVYPLPGVGPLPLLHESRRNHWGKQAFAWLYWHVLLPGRWLPLPAAMTMAGKHHPEEDHDAHRHDQ
jgi:sulfide:quinone oxidoreductase